jgi:hypothetical protein
MEKAFKQPLFVTGIPLAVCGFVFGLNGLLTEHTFAYMAPGFLIPGVVLMLCGWMKARKA